MQHSPPSASAIQDVCLLRCQRRHACKPAAAAACAAQVAHGGNGGTGNSIAVWSNQVPRPHPIIHMHAPTSPATLTCMHADAMQRCASPVIRVPCCRAVVALRLLCPSHAMCHVTMVRCHVQFVLAYFGPAVIASGQPLAAAVDATLVDLHRHFVLPMDAAAADASIVLALDPPLHAPRFATVGFDPAPTRSAHGLAPGTTVMGLPVLSSHGDTHGAHAYEGRCTAADEMDAEGRDPTECVVGAMPWAPVDDILPGIRRGEQSAAGKLVQLIVPSRSPKFGPLLGILRSKLTGAKRASFHVRCACPAPHRAGCARRRISCCRWTRCRLRRSTRVPRHSRAPAVLGM